MKRFTRDYLCEWVKIIDVSKTDRCLRLPEESACVSFNYTPMLELVYDVPANQIIHIHGSVLNGGESLQFGSPDNQPYSVKSVLEKKYAMDDFYGATIEQGVRVVVERCSDTWKNIAGNYHALRHYLNRFDAIDTVAIMGNTFDGVDYPYYCDVFAQYFKDANWVFCEYKHDGGRWEKIDSFCRRLKIKSYRMTGYEEFA